MSMDSDTHPITSFTLPGLGYVEVKVKYQGQSKLHRVYTQLHNGRVYVSSSAECREELKTFAGAKWHKEHGCWSFLASRRNAFRLRQIMGEPVFSWFDRPLQTHDYSRCLLPHQRHFADAGLTYHYQLWAGEPGVGKTLPAQEVIERSDTPLWYWVGPRRTLANIQREFYKEWDYNGRARIEFKSYDELKKDKLDDVPNGIVFDECHKLKHHASQRSKAAQRTTDAIRATHGMDGYVLALSGTPSPKSPVNWWSPCEVVWPGYLREGSAEQMEKRLGYFEDGMRDGTRFQKRTGWRDDESKCDVCGEGHDGLEDHAFKPSTNEVALVAKRTKGLVVVYLADDVLDLPEITERTVRVEPSASVQRVAKAIAATSPNTITAMTLLRELSDGFQYQDKEDGLKPCTHCEDGTVVEWRDPDGDNVPAEAFKLLGPEVLNRLISETVDCPACKGTKQVPRIVREAKRIPCPKEQALKDELSSCTTGRVLCFAGFTGAIDRVVDICHEAGWDVVRCDGRGFTICPALRFTPMPGDDPLDYWQDQSVERCVFVAHPESGGESFTLTEARKVVFWSNSFKPEFRFQALKRIHRLGQQHACEVVDLVHLATDQRVIDVIKDNRKLELMSLGEVQQAL